MPSQLLLAPSAVFQIPPPYDRFEAVPDLSALTPQDLPDAALLAIGLDPPRHALDEAAALVPQLRTSLTSSTGVPDEIEQWLPIRLPGLAPAVGQMIGLIVRLAPGFTEVSALLGTLGHAERTVRTWFRRAGVPGPGKWLAAAHAIHAALRLQAEESSPLLTIAVECGYSDHSSLSRQSLRLFGVRPGVIRRTLGWEWLLDRWLRRAAAGR